MSKSGAVDDGGVLSTMYQPPQFREDRLAVQHALIRAHPLGLLVTAGPGGLMANLVPFHLEETPGGLGVARAHLARANAQWREFSEGAECMVAFQGPQAYVSPSWYPTKAETGKVVPTWNYVTVHIWGRPRLIDQAPWLRGQIDALTDAREAARPEPWRADDAPADFIAAQIRGVVGLELPISRIEGKWKVSQNRNEADRRGVAQGLSADGPAAAAMADLVAAGGAGAVD